MIDIVEILTHWYAGRSQNELAASLGVDRKTLRKYTGPARAAGMAPGGPPMSEVDWRTLVCGWFPELVDTRLRQTSWPVIECYRDYIAAQLTVGVTAATIHQRLVDEQGLAASVASVRRWVAANLPEEARRGQVTVLRQCPPPGSEAQIDYGRLGMWLDPGTGRRRALAELAGGHADGTWTRRLRELARPAVLVLDDFAMRELTPAQADDLYELINERANRSLILTSNRSPVDWYPLFPNPVVAESLLDRLINNSHQLFMNGASYRPHKRPGRIVSPETTTTS